LEFVANISYTSCVLVLGLDFRINIEENNGKQKEPDIA